MQQQRTGFNIRMSFWKNTLQHNNLPTVSHGNGPYPSGNNNSNINTTNNNPPMYGQQQHYQSNHPSHPTTTTATSTGNMTIETNGPRAKCDQVVFEAIAKAAEIVVGSRCWIDPTNVAVQQQQQQHHQLNHHFYNTNNNGNGTSNGNGNVASSSRFNLFVLEVQGVRYVCILAGRQKVFVFPIFLMLFILFLSNFTFSSWCTVRFCNDGNARCMFHFV